MKLVLTALLAMGAAATCAAQAPRPDLQQAATMGAELFAKSSSTGMVLVVVRGHQVFFHGYGETAPGSGVVPNGRSLLRLCSLSKIFATDLLVKLEHDGALQLDAALQAYAPGHVVVPTKGGREITLLDLATHTSGLPREVGPAPKGTPHLTFPGYAYRWHWLPTQRLRTTPGTVAVYSNVGFDYLGDAIQRAAGEPYARLLAERTTRPLGMTETGFTPTAAQCARLLLSAHDEGPCTDTQSSAASAGVYSTATDMERWLEYLLGTGVPSVPAQTPDAQAVYVKPGALLRQQGLDHAGAVTGIGLGWMHTAGASEPTELVEKTGGGAGFVTYIALNQAEHTGIFFAMTGGRVNNHYNVFKGGNNLLLALDGLRQLPEDAPRPVRVVRRRRPRG